MPLLRASKKVIQQISELQFAAPVAYVYNPLDYAWKPHAAYLRRYGVGQRDYLLLGMNPGPFGMAQTGVPFGEVAAVRDFLGIQAPVTKPEPEHPKRPIEGFACTRSEVSGRRLWGWCEERFGQADAFFQRFFVHNFCPLVFMADSGRNITPDKLPKSEREPLFAICNQFLRRVVEIQQPKMVIGVGAFAEKQAKQALAGHDLGYGQLDYDLQFGRILHPSPASPLANRGWASQAERDFASLAVPL